MSLLGPNTGYIDLLDAATTTALQKRKDDGTDFQKTPIRPSAAGYCTRELYYQLMQFHGKAKYDTKINEPEVDRLLDLGHSIEWHLIKQFEKHLSMLDRKSTRLNSSHVSESRMPSSA